MTKHPDTTTVEPTVLHPDHPALLEELKATVAVLFGRREPRTTFWDLVTGLLMELPTANCWTIAEAVGHPSPYRMQHLLSRAVWDAEAVLAAVARWAVDHLGGPAVLAVDETGDAKSSTDAVGAAQQYSGALGGVGLCQVAVHLSLATPAGHAVIGRRLYLGADWASDDERRTLAGVPDDLEFATKPDLAITLIRQAVAAGVHAQYVTADEVYGSVAFRTACRTLGLAYVVAIPTVRQVTTADHRHRTCTDAIALVPATAWARMRTGSATKGAKDYDWALLAIEPDDTPTSDTSAAYLLRSSSARVAGWWVEGVLDSAAYPRSGRILRSVGDVKGRVAIAERRPEGPPLTCPVESGHWAPARGSRLVTRAF